MRKLVTIRRVDNIIAIPGADNIELAVVGAWQCVVKKGEFFVGSYGVYHEIDSWLPYVCEAYRFLMKPQGENKVFDGIEGYRLRTMKMRGVISQGLLLPISSLLESDLTIVNNVTKYEKYVTEPNGNVVVRNWPAFLPKTDQERYQNIAGKVAQWSSDDDLFEVTEKLDGSSCTVYFKDGVVGVCSRNVEIEEDATNPFWKVVDKYNLFDEISGLGRNIAIQGELISSKIQGNPYKLADGDFYFRPFNVFDIDEQKYLSTNDAMEVCADMLLDYVPILEDSVPLDLLGDLIEYADGQSKLNKNVLREGLVFKCVNDHNKSFRVVSNKWLLKNE